MSPRNPLRIFFGLPCLIRVKAREPQAVPLIPLWAGLEPFPQALCGSRGKTSFTVGLVHTSDDGSHGARAARCDPRVTLGSRVLAKYFHDKRPQLFTNTVTYNETGRRLGTGYKVRHKVVPGFAGLPKVNGYCGETSDMEHRKRPVTRDINYLRHGSQLRDLKVLAQAVTLFLRKEKTFLVGLTDIFHWLSSIALLLGRRPKQACSSDYTF